MGTVERGYGRGMDEMSLLELERAGWDALSRGEGSRFYERMLADQGVMSWPTGG
jgi:hypothetical protein